jgi:hypothetical protein
MTAMVFFTLLSAFIGASRLSGFRLAQSALHVEQSCVHSLIF